MSVTVTFLKPLSTVSNHSSRGVAVCVAGGGVTDTHKAKIFYLDQPTAF